MYERFAGKKTGSNNNVTVKRSFIVPGYLFRPSQILLKTFYFKWMEWKKHTGPVSAVSTDDNKTRTVSVQFQFLEHLIATPRTDLAQEPI